MASAFYVCKIYVIYPIQLITGRNEVVAKVMFLLVSVILFTGGVCLSACWDMTPWEAGPPRKQASPPQKQASPPGEQAPPGSRHPPGKQTSPKAGTPPPRHTVNERPVRILLECILVYCYFSIWNTFINPFTFKKYCYNHYQGWKRTGNLDVHFPDVKSTGNLPKNIEKYVFTPGIYFQHREKFNGLKIKGCTRIVAGCSYNLLALKQIFSWGQPNIGMKLL